MAKYISPNTVIEALTRLLALDVKRVGRTSVVGWLLIKAKANSADDTVTIASQGASSVEPQLQRFFRVSDSPPHMYINPFGKSANAAEYLAENYERRGTFTHLYAGRNLANFLNVSARDGEFEVRLEEQNSSDVATRLGQKLPWDATAAFLLRNEQFEQSPTRESVKSKLMAVFNLTEHEINSAFEDTSTIEFEFDDAPIERSLDALPEDMRPQVESDAHSSAKRVARLITPLAKTRSIELILDEALLRRVRRSLTLSKAIALLGPPGTAKSAIWESTLEAASRNPEEFGFTDSPEYICHTAEVDWTARTLIGGYYPQEDGKLVFREGHILQAIRNNQLVWIDEMNRADLDRVLGPILTFLAGQNVDLGLDHLGSGPAKTMLLAWGADAKSGVEEDEHQRVYHVGTDWRLLGTYNNVDRGRVFPMGSALLRRWALIPVQPVAASDAAKIFAQIDGLDSATQSRLCNAYTHHQAYLQLGPAPFIDMARYVAGENDEAIRDELLRDAYALHIGQQLPRVDPERREDFKKRVVDLFGAEIEVEINAIW